MLSQERTLVGRDLHLAWTNVLALALDATPIILVLLLVFNAACGPNEKAEVAQRDAAIQAAHATSTALAAPTVAAQQTADALATQTAAQATTQAVASAQAGATAQGALTAQAAATATAIAQATQQARDVDARVQAAIAATQAAVPTATPVPPTPVVIVVTQQPAPAPVYVPVPMQPPAPVYVPVPVPAPVGSAPQYAIDAINGSNNAYTAAKWSLDANDLLGHIVGRELSDGQAEVGGLAKNRTRVASTLVSGYVTSWNLTSTTRIVASTNETWRFVNYDADSYTMKKDNGTRLYRNIYTIDYVAGVGWRVSRDNVPNPNGESI